MTIGAIYYLTIFYKRDELAFRLATFYGSATIAGAFSGLVAFGVFQIDDPKVAGWKWLMIIEGGCTILLAAFALFWLPASPSTCPWFTKEEKVVAINRMLDDGSVTTDEKIDFRSSMQHIMNWRIMVYAVMAFAYGTAGAFVGNFTPQLVSRLGYSKVKTNLYTVARKYFPIFLISTR